jgi:hypothetical protein
LGAQESLHGLAVAPPVCLGAGTADRRPLASIEDAKLNARPVDRPAHEAVEGIDLPHQMAFAQSADGRIAGHDPDGRRVMGDQQAAGAQARGGGGGLAARMSPTDHNDIVRAHEFPI